MIKDKENVQQEELSSQMSANEEATGKVKEAARRIEEKESAQIRKIEGEDCADQFNLAEGDQESTMRKKRRRRRQRAVADIGDGAEGTQNQERWNAKGWLKEDIKDGGKHHK